MADFNDGIFGCFSNTSICILGCLSPYFLFGKNVEKMGENPVLWMFGLATVPCLVGAYMRGLIRTKYGIDGSFTNDCIIYWCFSPCAIIQEAKQLGSVDYLIDPPEMQKMERTEVVAAN